MRALLFGAACLLAVLRASPGGAPFSVDASEDASADFNGAPRLHSFAWAQWDGKWIFISGRTAGYHGVGQREVDFPQSTSNKEIWVIEPASPAKVYHYPVSALPASLGAVKDQWVATNPLYFQDKDTLYLAGGYGQDSKGRMVTFPLISSVNLPALVSGVIAGADTFSKTIAWAESPLVQATGGALLKLDDGLFYLSGGHVFMGGYRSFEGAGEKNTEEASQTYLGEIRKLRIAGASAGKLQVTLVESLKDPEFARRDFNAGLTILADGKSAGAALYGGVFTKDKTGFTHPIYFQPGSAPSVDTTFEQTMSAYSCASLLLYDPDTASMYTTFFGGIGRRRPPAEDPMPWINQISTVVKRGHETLEFVHKDRPLPAYVGTNAVFIPGAGLRRIRPDADVFDLRQFRGKRTLAGYIFGGIRAFPKQFPYTSDAPEYAAGNVITRASDVILKVYVTAP
jgi:hypothetical protein